MDQTPFPESYQLNNELHVDQSRGSVMLQHVDQTKLTLPGQPRIRLCPSSELDAYLERNHAISELNQLAPHLWLVY